MPACLRSVNG